MKLPLQPFPSYGKLILVKMKYFRYYPWGFQLLLFILMVFTMMSSAGVIIPSILTKMTGFAPGQLEGIGPDSPAALVNVGIWVQGILNLFIFLFPALLFAYLSTPRPAQYLGLRAPGKNIQLLLVIFIMLGATPILLLMDGLVSNINFGPKVKAAQQASDNMFNAFLNIHSFGSFIKVFFILAVIPAVGEEMFFRGVLMRFAKQRSKTMVFPILFTSVVFAYSHSNIYGYISIFTAAVLLAVIYNLTGSIWCSILAHFSFNGMQVTLSYMSNHNPAVKAFMASNTVPVYLLIGGTIVFALSFYLLLKNKTPLPGNWSDNFTPEELYQKPD